MKPNLTPDAEGGERMAGPGSMLYTIGGERANLLGGTAALLLQIANPLVAAGVAAHGTFQKDPTGRLRRTVEAVLAITFGTPEQASEMAGHVAQLHRPVHGTFEGQRYSALNPQLCLWVYATMVEVALDVRDLIFRRLTIEERAAYYEQSKPFAAYFNVTGDVTPGDYEAFQRYYNEALDRLAVSDQARTVASDIFSAKLYGIPLSWVLRLTAAGLLPNDRLRQAYGLKWGVGSRVAWWVLCGLVRGMVRCAPPRLRLWKPYRLALQRAAQA